MNILFYFAHPSQYLFLRATIIHLLKEGNEVNILIKTKDVLGELIKKDGLPYTNILIQKRGKSKLAILLSLIQRNLKLIPRLIHNRPDLMIGTDAAIAQTGWLLNIPRITIIEDDYDVVRSLARLTYPFTQTILCPSVCGVGKWSAKKVGYNGYQKLGYLHPEVFVPNEKIPLSYNLPRKYALIRLSALTAHHDFGIGGIKNDILDKVIANLESNGLEILISSEGKIKEKYHKYLLRNKPEDMHHILAFASLLISDSQSMSVEAAMLGVPSIRYSDFSGRISVLEELEHHYQLTFGIKSSDSELLIERLQELLSIENLKEVFQDRRKQMLQEKINVTAFLIWVITNFPDSISKIRDRPELQDRFIG